MTIKEALKASREPSHQAIFHVLLEANHLVNIGNSPVTDDMGKALAQSYNALIKAMTKVDELTKEER